MIDLTPLIQAAIVLLGTVITAVLVPYIRSKTDAARHDQIQSWINIAVYACEQMMRGSGRGKEKKRYVLDFLKSKGVTYDPAAVDLMIEAAVKELSGSPSLRRR